MGKLEYKIELSTSFRRLEETVDKRIKEGWEPLGGIAVSGVSLLQALIRKRFDSIRSEHDQY